MGLNQTHASLISLFTRELESYIDTVFTTNSTDPTDIKKSIDKDRRLETCALKAPFIPQVVTAGQSYGMVPFT